MGVDDAVGLVGALIGLVHPLTEEGNGLGVGHKPVVEGAQIHLAQATGAGHGGRFVVAAIQQGREFGITGHMLIHIVLVQAVALLQVAAEAIEEMHVAAGFDGQMEIRLLGGHGAARVHHHQLHIGVLAARLLDAAEDDGVSPGGIGPDYHQQLAQLQILVTGGDHILAKGALVGRHRRGHAQPRVGVDIGRAYIALHQLVGHIVIFGHQLTRDIEGHRVGA